MIERLNQLDSRIIYALVLVSMIVPLLKPLGLPLNVPPETVALYEKIEAMAPGTPIAISMDASPGGFDELEPGITAVLNHVARKELRVIGISFWEAGPSLLQKVIDASDMGAREYGTDYVNLGYVAGGETGMAAVARDVKGMYPVDFNGDPTANMSVLNGIDTLQDVEMIICVAIGTPGVPEWIRQVGDPLDVTIATVVFAGLVAEYVPYTQSRQLDGMVPGLRGAAGYEGLISKVARGTAGIDAQSMAHVVILALIVIGNVAYFVTKSGKGEGKGGNA
jgi:hypothetical protein